MVGLIDHERHITTQWFKMAGDAIILVGTVAGVADPDSQDKEKTAEVNDLSHSLGGSQFLKVCHDRKEGPPPRVDLDHEIRTQTRFEI